MGQRRIQSTIGRAVALVTLTSTGVAGLAVPRVSADVFVPPADGGVIAWGVDVEGQLGDGDRANVDTPSEVPGLFATSIEAGDTFSFAVDASGAVLGWGRDRLDLVAGNGVGFSNDMWSPIGFDGARVEAGFFHALALKADGSMWAWGADVNGTLGDGAGDGSSDTPRELTLPGEAPVVDFAAGGFHSIVVTADGTAYAFGSGNDGQLGLANGFIGADAPTPVVMPEGVGVVDVAAGWYHSLAIGTDGQLYAWGNDLRYQLGTGGFGSNDVPAVVTLAPGVLPVAISAGGEFSLAIGDDGRLYSWGSDDFGVLGNGPGGWSSVARPQLAELPSEVTPVAISAGGYHSLMLGDDGRVYAWGGDIDEQIGDGPGAVTVDSMVSVAEGPFTAVSAGFNHSLALASDGQVWAWGGDAFAQTGLAHSSGAVGTELPVGAQVSSLAAGIEHTMAVADGGLWAWGSDDFEKLGNGPGGSVAAPQAIGLPAGVTPREVSAAWVSSLMIATDGRVFTWGSDQDGQLGNGPGGGDVSRPTAIELAPGVRGVTAASGGEHHLVIGDDGRLYAFGRDSFGQLGDGPTGDGGWAESPVVVNLPPSVRPVMIAAGRAFSLAVGDNGVLYGWGNNQFAQFGQGSADGIRSVPTVISLPAGFVPVQLVAGGAHVLVVGADGSLYGWGRDDFGQVGNGTANDGSNVLSPTALTLPAGVRPVSVAAGRLHTVMLGSDGQIYGWGRRTEGQLGNRAVITSSQSSPTVLPLGAPVSEATAVVAGAYHNLVVTGSTPRTVPQAPSAPTATLTGATTATVSFSPPAGDGGWPVRWYRATCVSSNGGATRSARGVTSPVTVSGLTVNRAYTCSVRAINALGLSDSSSSSNQVVTESVPGSPTGLSVTVANGRASVAFVPPSDAGGSPISSYRVVCGAPERPSRSASGASSPVVVTGLEVGTGYTCRAAAQNATGWGPASVASATFDIVSAPGAPQGIVAVVSGAGRVRVDFEPPVSDGGSPVTGYRTVCSSPSGDPRSSSGASSPLTVTGMTIGAPYTCQVWATNAVGRGGASTASAQVVPIGAPSAPTGVASSLSGSARLSVTFSPPTSTGGSPVTGYRVTCSSPTGAVRSSSGSTSPIVVTGLTAGATYTCNARALNAVATGAASAESAPVLVTAVPTAPTNVVAVPTTTGRFSVSFTPPANTGGSAITSYRVVCSTAGQSGRSASGAASPLVITGLTVGATYTCRASATNAIGASTASAASPPVVAT